MENTPKFLSKGMTIGLCAPSFGCADTPYKERYEQAIKKFQELGYKIVATPSCTKYYDMCSAPREIRAKEFMDLMLDDNIDFVISCGGGEIMAEILPYIDFEAIKNCPKKKYFMGYSDNTNLVFTLPIFANTPAIYSECIAAFGYNEWNEAIQNIYDVITGTTNIQKPYLKCEDPFEKDPDTLIQKEAKFDTCWKRYDKPNEPVTIKGRSIGGCIDILNELRGTKWGNIDSYLEEHKDEGFIFFMESCELNVVSQKRTYWALKQSGYFKYCNGIVIGRPMVKDEMFGHTYVDMIEELKELNVPIIYDFDMGHVGPMLTLIEGVNVEVHYEQDQSKCYIKHNI